MRLLQRLLYNLGMYYTIFKANILIRLELLKININPPARHRNQHKENRKLKTGISRIIKALRDDYDKYKVDGADLVSICTGYEKTPQEIADEIAIRKRLLNDYKQESEFGMSMTFEKNFEKYKTAQLKSKAYRAQREALEAVKQAKLEGQPQTVIDELNAKVTELTIEAREYGKKLRELNGSN